MAHFSLRKLFRPTKRSTKPTTTTKPSLPSSSDPHSLALSRSLSLKPTTTKRRRGRHASTPTLPPELIFHVFRQATDCDAEGRLRALRTIALLCRATRNWAEERLYEHPVLGETKGINAFLRTVKRSPSLAARVKRLTLDGWESTGDHRRGRGRRTVTGRLSQVLQLCRHLTELEIKGAIVFSLTDFAGAENLLHLTLTQTLLSDRTTTSRYHPFFTVLRSLHSLSLSQTTFDAPTAAHFLCPTTLPRLKVLEMDGGVGLVDDPTTQRGLGGYEPLLVGEQIEFLRLGGGGGGRVGGGRVEGEAGEGEAGFVQHCPTLQGLSLPLSTISDALLASLPPTLSWLEIRSGSEVMETHHLAAARALATTLLALAPSGSCTPGGLSRSPSSTLLSVSVSPTGGGLASFAHSGEEEGQGSPLPLSGLGRLLLPPEWEAWSGGGGAGGERGERGGGGEMSWAMGRIGRVAEARGVGVTFASASGSGVGEAARRWEGEGERE